VQTSQNSSLGSFSDGKICRRLCRLIKSSDWKVKPSQTDRQASEAAGLPDALFFHTKNPNSAVFWNGLGTENVGIFYDRVEYFTAMWYILWPFGIVCAHWYIFPVLVCLDQDKSGNPARSRARILKPGALISLILPS
jgi:hypothetical protein